MVAPLAIDISRGLIDILGEGLAPLGDRLRVAFVFGSAARGELSAASDGTCSSSVKGSFRRSCRLWQVHRNASGATLIRGCIRRTSSTRRFALDSTS
jgi:hypothetical protein